MSPRISQTESQILEIGDTGVEGEIYAGKIDWQALESRGLTPLREEEQAFLDGPVEELCRMAGEYETFESEEQDIPPAAWDFIREKGFLGMIIPKEYGGLEFSALAHAQVIQKLASRNFTAAISVMVPNSLGPAELILHYGTDGQKQHWLPRLAKGEEIPCFGLTEPAAGSDATGITARAIVEKDERGAPVLHIENLDKRYITLAPVATLIGLAVSVEDPDDILGLGKKPGITVALVPRDTPGLEIGNRHRPMDLPFQNGPVRCAPEGIRIPVDEGVVGGRAGVGKGWPMLVTLLSAGRGISLPTVSVAAMKSSLRTVSAYTGVRRQFGQPLSAFEGVGMAVGEIAGLTYLSEAVRLSTLRTIDGGAIPSVATAMVKYHLTETMRKVVNNAMDILGGKAVMNGPRNLVQRLYRSVPVAITVEGANIMTRNLMIFGQGGVRAHPWLLEEMEAAKGDDMEEAAEHLWDLVVGHHIPEVLANMEKARTLGKKTPDSSLEGCRLQLERLCAAFNVAANLCVATVGGKLKYKESLSARMGDAMSNLYMAVCVLEKFANDGSREEDRPFAEWACAVTLHRAETALAEFIPNYAEFLRAESKKNPMLRTVDLARLLEKTVFPKGRRLAPPTDSRTLALARAVSAPGELRDRLTAGLYDPGDEPGNPAATLEKAFQATARAREAERKRAEALRAGTLAPSETLADAVAKGILTDGEAADIKQAEDLAAAVIAVDDVPSDRITDTMRHRHAQPQ